jgi:plasmid maintenance system antidote protein VapI
MIQIKTVQFKEVDLIKLCKIRGLNPRQLAIAAGVSYHFLNKVINGHHSVSEEIWAKLKVVLDRRKDRK